MTDTLLPFLHGILTGGAVVTATLALVSTKATQFAILQAKARSKAALAHAVKAEATMDRVHSLTTDNLENLTASLAEQQRQIAALERNLNLLRDRPPGTPSAKTWRLDSHKG